MTTYSYASSQKAGMWHATPHMSSSSEFNHWKLQSFRIAALSRFWVVNIYWIFWWNLSRQKLSYSFKYHAIIKSKHVMFMILIALTDVTNFESWIPEVNAFRRLSIPPSKVLGTARLSYAVGARLFTHIWCAWTPWCEFIWVGQGLPEPCSNKTGYGEVNADVVKLDHIFWPFIYYNNRRTWCGGHSLELIYGSHFQKAYGLTLPFPTNRHGRCLASSLWTSSMDEISGGKKNPQFQLDRRMDLRMFVKNCMCNEST